MRALGRAQHRAATATRSTNCSDATTTVCYAVCRRITGNEADAADAAQEAMIAMVRGLARFDGRASFGTWAYRIATNASLDELRRRRRRPLVAGPRSRQTHDHARARARRPHGW